MQIYIFIYIIIYPPRCRISGICSCRWVTHLLLLRLCRLEAFFYYITISETSYFESLRNWVHIIYFRLTFNLFKLLVAAQVNLLPVRSLSKRWSHLIRYSACSMDSVDRQNEAAGQLCETNSRLKLKWPISQWLTLICYVLQITNVMHTDLIKAELCEG